MSDRRPILRALRVLRPAVALLPVLGAGVLAGGLPGCNIVGPAAYFIGGLPKVEAQYVLADVPTVVFVDDRANVIGSSAMSIRLAVADKVTEELMVNKCISQPNMISPRDAVGIVRARDRHSELLSIDAIGRLVGAKQVIYVEMLQFTLAPDGVTPQPAAACAIRIIDAEERVRLYPMSDPDQPLETQAKARPIQVDLPPVDPQLFTSQSSRIVVLEMLAEKTGDQIAKLFYRHEPREVGDRLNPR